MLDLIISHGIDLTDIDIVPQSNNVIEHVLVSCMLHITDINYMALRHCLGKTIVPATKDRFTNNLPDLSQLLCVPINTNELDKIASNMGTIFSNTLETVAPIKLKKIREKCAAPWYNSYTHSLKKETCNLEHKWRKTTFTFMNLADAFIQSDLHPVIPYHPSITLHSGYTFIVSMCDPWELNPQPLRF